MNKLKLKFISKTLFIPKHGVLIIGDLHLGYDSFLKNQGINVNYNQLDETKKEIEIIIKKIQATSILKKIILLGDLKHHFSFEKIEIFDLRNFLKFLEKLVDKKNLILIKGNHDTFNIKNHQMKDFYIQDGIAFIHGDKWFSELNDKGIKIIIMSHIHPAILLKDQNSIKKEKYKCFLVGKFKGKEVIIIPSFFSFFEGSELNFHDDDLKKDFSIITKKKLEEFETFIVGKDKVYKFGKFKDFK